ncbi:hypothetical protein A3SI_00615 [Nitritalea halalkaliphila LW7]|uniref:DUF3108 domain-containing protein n=1 Tax=Nitritalea halalkaliphila LW7 TaxID=1189621 RepID=I5CAR5_9BACT|nr:DUF6134 family protein [Nitritalea halalkaliphila]EIM78917.1 hypothetical protein A3SI_00615 [Nitritalea halalkaliphila LW7]
MNRELLLLSFFLIPFLSRVYVSEAQVVTHKYEISVAGFSIGEMQAKKQSKENSIIYSIESKVSFWFFGRVEVDYGIETRYDGSKVVESKAYTKTNRGDFTSHVQWDRGGYEVDAETYKFENKERIEGPLRFSSARMYFHEPTNETFFLAENYGLKAPVKKVQEYYEVDVNGNKNKFYYDAEGVLIKAVMQSPIKNYVISRIE